MELPVPKPATIVHASVPLPEPLSVDVHPSVGQFRLSIVVVDDSMTSLQLS